jgi:cytochrome c1
MGNPAAVEYLLERQRSWVVRSWRVRIWMLLSIVLPAVANTAAASAGDVERGSVLFVGNGCGACHTIKGTEAHGAIGPDLSHVGSRMTIGAGLLPNTEQDIARFIARPDRLKPGVKMPNFDMLPKADIQAMAAYLKALQ